MQLAEAFKDWRWADAALLMAALGATYADSETTKDVLKDGGQELNPLLGKHPSGADLDKAALLTGLAGTTAAGMMDQQDRRKLLGAWAALRATTAYQNAHIKKGEKEKSLGETVAYPALAALAGGYLATLIPDNGLQVGVSLSPHESKLSLSKRF